jgi:hypothetical protein
LPAVVIRLFADGPPAVNKNETTADIMPSENSIFQRLGVSSHRQHVDHVQMNVD